jgi:CHASE2 domain-containing sensor protein
MRRGITKAAADILAAGFLLALFGLGTLSYFEHMLQDAAFQRPGLPHPDIVVIGIDERAIERFGTPDQWSRNLMAEAIEILNRDRAYQPAVIALDILYVGQREDREADLRLAHAARDGGNVVTAARAVMGAARAADNPARAVNAVVGWEKPFDDLARYAAYGIVNAIFDQDRRVRSAQLAYRHDGGAYYSFPYEIYRMYTGEVYEPWANNREKYIIFHGPPGTFKQFSFADIFDDDFEPEFLADAIVMIGMFAPGLDQGQLLDAYHVSGYPEQMHGVEIHANSLQTLIDGIIKEYAPFAVNLAILLLFLAAALALAYFLEIRVLLAAYAGLVLLYAGAALLAFHMGYILTLVYPAVSLVFVYLCQLVYRYAVERIERRKAQLIAEKHQILVDSINYARVIQRGILPRDSIFAQAFADYSIRWDPRDTVGGDIYWIKTFEKGTLLCVCDCTGHGVPGALLTALVVSAFEEIVTEEVCGDPAAIVWMLDQKLIRVFESDSAPGEKNNRAIHIRNGCDLAVLFIDRDGNVAIASGNFNVFVCDGKEVRRYKGQKLSVGEGKITSREAVKVTAVPACKDNKFYISSDGMYDQIGGARGHSFGYNPLKQIILEHHHEKQEVICAKVWETFEAYRGDQVRRDDFELITFQPFA